MMGVEFPSKSSHSQDFNKAKHISNVVNLWDYIGGVLFNNTKPEFKVCL